LLGLAHDLVVGVAHDRSWTRKGPMVVAFQPDEISRLRIVRCAADMRHEDFKTHERAFTQENRKLAVKRERARHGKWNFRMRLSPILSGGPRATKPFFEGDLPSSQTPS
jgi:hypothetical protein